MMDSMNKTPLVSVIVPVYNAEKYLARCLDSLLGQTYGNLEIICVNDGSPDNSLAILHEYAAKDARIKVIDQPNRGVSAARNAGLACASGDFISFVDSDDALVPHCYETCMKHAADDVDVVAFSFAKVFGENKKEAQKLPFEGKMRFEEGMLSRQFWNAAFKLFRASALKKYGMTFREGFIYEDLEFCARFFMVCMPTVYYINEPLYDYWQNPGSIISNTAARKEGQSIQHIYQLDGVYEFLKKHDALASSIRDFLALCEYCFRSAYRNAPAYEKAKCCAELTARLRSWALDYSRNPLLASLYDGGYTIDFNKDVYKTRLKGGERFFCVRREGDYKVFRLFGCRVIRIRKKG